jgi:ribosomal silencing factor RsfS
MWKDLPLQNGVLMDYVDVVVHVFQKKQIREYYDLEGLWGDARVKHRELPLITTFHHLRIQIPKK